MEKEKNKRMIGNQYEDRAVCYIKEQGYEVLHRNFRCRMGEIDIIARDGIYLCFLEVKFRNSLTSGAPREAVTYYKQKRITKTAQYYMMLEGIYEDVPCRFDVVECTPEEITIVQNAFDAILS